MNYYLWDIEIDFNNPLLSQNKMIDIVNNEVEPNSFFGRAMGKVGNTGEGIVVSFPYKGTIQRFKVKGEKHSSSKVKTLKPVNEEKEKRKIEFANYACSPSRLEQVWQSVFGIDNELFDPSIKFIGIFIKEVVTDILKEESDIMFEKELNPKDIGKNVSKIAKSWFMEQLEKIARWDKR